MMSPDPDDTQEPVQPEGEPALSPAEAAAPQETVPQHKSVYVGTGVSWAVIFGALLIVVIAILAALNTTAVSVNLIFWKGDIPLISIILGVAAAAVVIDELVGLAIRRRRRRRFRQRDELKELKRGSG
jgi:uncharacterized integral membrane protein